MKRLLTLISVSAVIGGCSGISVTQDYDTSVDFSRLKTYAWDAQAQRKTDNEPADNSLVKMRVRSAVDRELAAKGYQKVDTSQANSLVAYSYTIQERTGSDNVRTGVGIGVGTGSRGSFGGVGFGFGQGDQSYEQDTLTIDMVDPKSGKLIWRGFARQRLERQSDPEKTTARFNATVAAILAQFPPEVKR